MKFKSIFLGMLGAAALISCNNESAIEPQDQGGNGEYVEGLETYATIDLVVKGVSTYAGEAAQPGITGENEIGNAGLMIYKWDGSNTYPESYAYVASIAAVPKAVTLKTTSGMKKVFLACNIGSETGTPRRFVKMTTSGAFGTTVLDEGGTYGVSYTDMNNTLYTNAGSTDFTLAPVAIPIAAADRPADGLIKALAGGTSAIANGHLYSKTLTNADRFLLTNWDGVSDTITGGGANYESTCLFTLIADVPKSETQTNLVTSRNRLTINVQRAVAKIGVVISAGGGAAPYTAASTEPQEGKFSPLTVSGNEVWSLGNIAKEEKPFQTYAAGVVQDHNYLATDDSIHQFPKWISRYDNTRIFGDGISTYPAPGVLTVTSAEAAMTAADNFNSLNVGNPVTWNADNYAYAPENARKYPVTHDFGTYIVVAGVYEPKTWVRQIYRKAVDSNLPDIIESTSYAANPSTVYGGPSVTSTNPNTGLSETLNYNDSLYYINKTGTKLFIAGRENLLRYYAWYEQKDPSVTAAAVASSPAAIAAVNEEIKAGNITAYYQGHCFYRVFISNSKGDNVTPPTTEQNATRRNHIYQVNITNIKGPGIADPNNILVPGEPIPVLDTYVTAVINVMDWHVVNQEAEVEGK